MFFPNYVSLFRRIRVRNVTKSHKYEQDHAMPLSQTVRHSTYITPEITCHIASHRSTRGAFLSMLPPGDDGRGGCGRTADLPHHLAARAVALQQSAGASSGGPLELPGAHQLESREVHRQLLSLTTRPQPGETDALLKN